MNLNEMYAINEDVVYRTTKDGSIILDLNNDEHYSMNKTATAILEHIETNRDLDFILSDLRDQYDQSFIGKEGTVMTFIQQLLNKGLIRKYDGGKTDAKEK